MFFYTTEYPGAVMWSYSPAYGTSSPIVADGTIYCTLSYELIAADAATGVLKWSYQSAELNCYVSLWKI